MSRVYHVLLKYVNPFNLPLLTANELWVLYAFPLCGDLLTVIYSEILLFYLLGCLLYFCVCAGHYLLVSSCCVMLQFLISFYYVKYLQRF